VSVSSNRARPSWLTKTASASAGGTPAVSAAVSTVDVASPHGGTCSCAACRAAMARTPPAVRRLRRREESGQVVRERVDRPTVDDPEPSPVGQRPLGSHEIRPEDLSLLIPLDWTARWLAPADGA